MDLAEPGPVQRALHLKSDMEISIAGLPSRKCLFRKVDYPQNLSFLFLKEMRCTLGWVTTIKTDNVSGW